MTRFHGPQQRRLPPAGADLQQRLAQVNRGGLQNAVLFPDEPSAISSAIRQAEARDALLRQLQKNSDVDAAAAPATFNVLARAFVVAARVPQAYADAYRGALDAQRAVAAAAVEGEAPLDAAA